MEVSYLSSSQLFIQFDTPLLVGPIGAAGSGGGLDSLAASLPFPPQGQLVADYFVEGSAPSSSGEPSQSVSGNYSEQR